VPYEGAEVIERLTIYNRWGQRIYVSTGPGASWDGTADGKPAPADVYVWLLELRCADGEQGQRHGDVTLLR
ncbi:MAG: gliding motility-associated C-terminal domain-containing protein, partial [Thermoanaerobaculia bacterium]|nr:gliding motility-associated C-terminal domain-containing protein [Thermoanaerobaculia bacterium]